MCSLFLGCDSLEKKSNEVNLYSQRHYAVDELQYKNFTKLTGIKVNVVKANADELIERLKNEGENSPADLFITVDAGKLQKAAEFELLQKVNNKIINNNVSNDLKDKNSFWVPITYRARIVVYSNDRVQKSELSTYEDLAKPEWNGRVVIRKSSNMYNQSLVASLVANHGVEATEAWANGLVSNMARKPEGNDRAQIMAVANGEADIAVANSYYIALMLSGKKGAEQQAAANKVVPFFPGQGGRGTHINVSGIGMLKLGPNRENALKLIEFLLSETAQNHIVNNSFEYPLLEGVNPHPLIAQFGTDFKQDQTPVSSYGEFNPDAVKLMERAGW